MEAPINTVISSWIAGPTLFITVIFIIWSLIWKGVALWSAARRMQKTWFIVLLLVNTGGILEMIYIFFVAPKQGQK
ncbi:MAG: DUF5652 family protein [bacterium]|nr:DUF5652 family protein [bacterium]